MAFSAPTSGGRRRGRALPPTLSEMNIVPLVDVVLVLLIIFMITAQAMEFGLEIEVPKVKRSTPSVKELPVLSISRRGELKLNEAPLANIALIGPEVRRRFGPTAKDVYIRCDKNATVDLFAQAADACGRAGLKVNFVTKTD
ncbi:MAG: biopolymer transporter ExbD [Bryobacteraceae bacterium]|nr:biopolymer transporter ExbD [Bryobacteraceae bacterium]